MGERQNFYSLQLPEPGHIPSPRDSGLTGLFIISLAFFCVRSLRFGLVCWFFLFFFFPEWKSLRWKRNAEEGEIKKKNKKNPPGSLSAPVAAEGLDKPRSFFFFFFFFLLVSVPLLFFRGGG